MAYQITSQAAIRRAFWESHPQLDRKRIADHSGKGKMYKTDTRCAFVDYVDMLSKDGLISPELAHRTTLG
jgi:hypothetical protein